MKSTEAMLWFNFIVGFNFISVCFPSVLKTEGKKI